MEEVDASSGKLHSSYCSINALESHSSSYPWLTLQHENGSIFLIPTGHYL